MSSSAFAYIHILSQETHQPELASKAMHFYFTTGLKLTRRVQTTNLLNTLRRQNIGTNEVEKWSRICGGQMSSHIKNNDRKLVSSAMKMKVEDAQWNEKQMKKKFLVSKTQYRNVIKRNSFIDVEFQKLLRSELGKLWQQRKEANQKKLKHLNEKWRHQSHPNENKTKGVKYKDIDIDAEVNDKNDKVVQYGGVDMNSNLEAVLSLNPKMMTYSRISKNNVEVEIEKAVIKQRYEHMRADKSDEEPDEEELDEVVSFERKRINYSRVRATQIPTNPRLILPKPTTLRQESAMAETKQRMLEKVDEYVKNRCDEKGYPQSNLTKDEKNGLKEIKKRIEEKEVVVFKTDKSGKLCVDKVENYKTALEVHTENDTKIDMARVETIEKGMNKQAKVFNKIFSVGQDHPRDKERIEIASTSTNVPPPPLYGLRKDHKKVAPGQENAGPPVRPVCAAKVAPNSRVSTFLCKVINDFCEGVDEKHEVKSSEEMRSALEEFNENTDEEERKKCKIMSFDVKSLYPSVTKRVAEQGIKELIMNSDMEVMNINYKEMSKYLFVMMAQEEIENEGLSEIMPKRVKMSRKPLTLNCLLSNKPEHEEWVMGRNATEHEKRVMLANTIAVGVKYVMASHTYKMGDDIYLQTEGCPIG